MNFKDLQRFFSGKFSEKEKMHLLCLYGNSNGRKILADAFEEGWEEAFSGKGPDWDSCSCFRQILKKLESDPDTISHTIH